VLGKDILVMGGYGGMDLEARTAVRKTGENPEKRPDVLAKMWRK